MIKSLFACTTREDAVIHFPEIGELPDRPLQLDIWIKVTRDFEALNLHLQQEKDAHTADEGGFCCG